ncbi:unnamed protein product, partial [Discosporangium mesarthrocarpum]
MLSSRLPELRAEEYLSWTLGCKTTRERPLSPSSVAKHRNMTTFSVWELERRRREKALSYLGRLSAGRREDTRRQLEVGKALRAVDSRLRDAWIEWIFGDRDTGDLTRGPTQEKTGLTIEDNGQSLRYRAWYIKAWSRFLPRTNADMGCAQRGKGELVFLGSGGACADGGAVEGDQSQASLSSRAQEAWKEGVKVPCLVSVPWEETTEALGVPSTPAPVVGEEKEEDEDGKHRILLKPTVGEHGGKSYHTLDLSSGCPPPGSGLSGARQAARGPDGGGGTDA